MKTPWQPCSRVAARLMTGSRGSDFPSHFRPNSWAKPQQQKAARTTIRREPMSVKKFVPSRVGGVLLFAAAGLAGSGGAIAQAAVPATATQAALINFDIPTQDLGDAL